MAKIETGSQLKLAVWQEFDSRPSRRFFCAWSLEMEITRQTKFEQLPELLTIEEFRAFLGMSKTAAYELVRTNQVKHRRFGRRIWIPREVLR